MTSRVAGILLAAGDGSRLGQPKATVELAGSTLAERGVALLRDGGTDPVIVVTGAIPVEIPGVVSVHNPDWLTGMGSSLAHGAIETMPIGPKSICDGLMSRRPGDAPFAAVASGHSVFCRVSARTACVACRRLAWRR